MTRWPYDILVHVFLQPSPKPFFNGLLALKRASPFKYTFIAELANGSIGYVPNRTAYAEGNYEVVSARCAEGSGEMLVDTAARMLNVVKSRGQ